MICCDTDFWHLAPGVFIRFVYCKVTFFSPYILFFGNKSLNLPTPVRRVKLRLLEGQISTYTIGNSFVKNCITPVPVPKSSVSPRRLVLFIRNSYLESKIWDPGMLVGGTSGKESACQCRRLRFDPSVGKIPLHEAWQPTPVSLPGESGGQRMLVGYSPWGHKRVGHYWSDLACTRMSLLLGPFSSQR